MSYNDCLIQSSEFEGLVFADGGEGEVHLLTERQRESESEREREMEEGAHPPTATVLY